MRIKLKKLATVQMGYSFRSRLEISSTGTIGVIQMKDLLNDNTVGYEHLVKTEIKTVKEHHIVRKGDLIFRSRGLVSTAALLLKDLGQTVVAAPLLRIRITNPEQILPEYLTWYISQRDAQIFLTSSARGTFQQMISKQVLENLEIMLPSLEKQKNIVELASLMAKEKKLLCDLADKKEQYVSTTLLQFAKGE